MRHSIRAIIFDAFGTLVTPVPRKGPYQELAAAAGATGRRFRDEAMTLDVSIADFAARYGRPDLAEGLEMALEEQIASVKLFDEVGAYLSLLDVPYAICSNLAHGYGQRVKELVPGARGYAMSYEIGAFKPQPEIYRAAIDLVGVAPESILFVGDTPRADVEGPRAIGMKAVQIDRIAGDTLDSVMAVGLRDAFAHPTLEP